MTNSRPRISLSAAIILLTMLACAVPGLSPASLPAPTADSVLLATMVAGTVSAALAETENARPQAPTSTPVPPTPTETPAPGVGAAGSALAKRGDGSTFFSDQLAGYEVTVPAGWLAVRINEQEYFDAWALAETSNPAVQRSLTSVQNQDPKQFRLFALDTQDGHIQGGFVTNVNFLWDENDGMSFDDDTDLKAAASALKEAAPGLEVLTTEITATSSGIPIGALTLRWPATTVDGVKIVVFQKQVFIKVSSGTLAITLSTTEGLMDTILPVFDAMIETVSILN